MKGREEKGREEKGREGKERENRMKMKHRELTLRFSIRKKKNKYTKVMNTHTSTHLYIIT